jgi:sterol desaturase/sphingolipid hydroxylase (fatty acid hydroxylase superfamily)
MDILAKLLVLIGGRYVLLAGLAFLVCYVLLRKRWANRRVQLPWPRTSDYLREIGYSVVTIVIFAAVAWLCMVHPAIAPHTTLYHDIAEYGWAWYVLAYPVMLVMHDTYFYFTHRLMHHRSIFPYVHLVHHRSTNPSPWAAYAFHPLEAVVETGIVPVFLFTIPVHRSHLVLFFLLMIIYNVYGHLGYELYPKGFQRTRIGRWINTSVNHNQHHQYFKGNYGLYLLFWDRMLGTIRPDYDQRFDEVTTRPQPAS